MVDTTPFEKIIEGGLILCQSLRGDFVTLELLVTRDDGLTNVLLQRPLDHLFRLGWQGFGCRCPERLWRLHLW